MKNVNAPVRRSLVAAVALGAGLTLAACGGDEESESPDNGEDTSETEETSETESDAGAESGSDDAESPTEGGFGGESPSDEAPSGEAGSAGPGGESGSAGATEAILEVTAPEGWQDLVEAGVVPQGDGVAETYAYAPADDQSLSTSISVLRLQPGTVEGDSYLEMLEQSGQDTSQFTELEPRDVGGYEAEGLEAEVDNGTGTQTRMQSYGVSLDDGSFVEIAFSAPPEEFDAQLPEFEAVLDSIQVNE